MAKSKKQKLRAKCDRLWFKILLNKYPKCEVCSKETKQIHHFFGKHLYSNLRFDLRNGVGLCLGCHFQHHHGGNPTIHQEVITKRGKRWYNSLLKKSKVKLSSYLTIKYYEDIKKALEKETLKM